MNTNGIAFKLSMYYDESIHGFIEKLLDNLPFKLKKMSPATIHKKTNYNKATFYDLLYSSFKRNIRFSTSVSQDFNNTIMLRYDNISNVITMIMHSKDCTDESVFLNKLNNIFNSINIINASFRYHLDNLLSGSNDISFYEYEGIDTSKMKKVINYPFKNEVLDLEQFSRHSHEYGGIIFTSTYIMWFGTDFFKFVPKETLTSFSDCVSNEILDNGTVRIQLYEDINDYNTDETDHRQWAFRKHTNIDEVAEKWNAEYHKMASENMSGANMIIENGSFEHGGVRRLKVYLDKDRKQAVKKEAVFMKVIEYDSCNKIVYEEEVIL